MAAIGIITVTAVILTASINTSRLQKADTPSVVTRQDYQNSQQYDDTSSKLGPVETEEPQMTKPAGLDVKIGSIVNVTGDMTYYESSETALNRKNPTYVKDEFIYPGEYEVNYIAVYGTNENGVYTLLHVYDAKDKDFSTLLASRTNPNLKYAVHIKIPDVTGKINDIGWLNYEDVQTVIDRGGMEYEHTRTK